MLNIKQTFLRKQLSFKRFRFLPVRRRSFFTSFYRTTTKKRNGKERGRSSSELSNYQFSSSFSRFSLFPPYRLSNFVWNLSWAIRRRGKSYLEPITHDNFSYTKNPWNRSKLIELNCAVNDAPRLELRILGIGHCVRMIADKYTQFVDPSLGSPRRDYLLA